MVRKSGLLLMAAAVVGTGFWVARQATARAENPLAVVSQQPQMAKGYVYHDKNKNGKRDAGEPGIAGIKVSDQTLITRTDRNGFWQLPLEEDQDTRYFVIKPRNWMTPVSDKQLPVFYYNHKPAGSPKVRFGGVEPTGPLPASIDFALTPRKEPTQFKALFFGDSQPRDVREVDYLRRDVIEPIIGKHDVDFGVTLGDIVFDDLTVFEPYINAVALLGIPWYNVLGNHDINFDVPNDEHSDETFERYFGPNYYSFDHGPVHFVVLDNVEWKREGEGRGGYTGKFGEKQLAWLEKDLSMIPQNQLVVLMMHIPITGCSDKEQLFRLIEKRPYALSVSAHTHTHEHVFITDKDGWKGPKPHHHVVNVTTSGSWWRGAPDENGIPHTTMRDGAPNGYSIFSFDGAQYTIEFRAARRHENYQMEIHLPDVLKASEARDFEVLVNVFAGSERSKVEMRVGDGAWQPMEQVRVKDPAYVKMWENDKELQRPYRNLPDPADSSHIWKAKIGQRVPRGFVPIHVRTTDQFGQVYLTTRGVRIE